VDSSATPGEPALVRPRKYALSDAQGEGVPISAIIRRVRKVRPNHAARQVLAFGWRHSAFITVLGFGAVLRVIAWMAYQPAIIVLADSNGYLRTMVSFAENKELRPAFYPAFLKAILALDSLALVSALQHLFVLVIAVGLYCLLLRLGVHRIVAAIGVTPVLLDAYQINLEQHILAEALFQSFVVGAVLLLIWPQRVSVWGSGLAGLLLALGSLTRFVGFGVIPFALLYLLVRRVGWLRFGSMAMGIALPLVAYAAWNRGTSGDFVITDRGGHVFYATKVSRFADCGGLSLPEAERQLCIDTPVAERKKAYPPWNRRSPLADLEVPPGEDEYAIVGSFNRRMLLRQPLDYARLVVADLAAFFSWRSPPERESLRVTRWQFFERLGQVKGLNSELELSRGSPPAEYGLGETFRIEKPLASFLRSYQRYGYQYGFMASAFLLLALLGGILGEGRRGAHDLRIDCLWLTFAGLSLYLFPALLSTFHFRYSIAAIPLLGPAGVLGGTLLFNRLSAIRRRRAQSGAKARTADTAPTDPQATTISR
jgi:hypothetical protein